MHVLHLRNASTTQTLQSVVMSCVLNKVMEDRKDRTMQLRTGGNQGENIRELEMVIG